jgi:hypothetical protein
MKYITPQRTLFFTMALVFLVLASTGWLVPRWTGDTKTYIHPWAWESIWGTMRNPLLGFLLAPLNDHYILYPAVVLGLLYVASYNLYHRLVKFGTSEYAALALTLPLLMSNVLLLYGNQIQADFPALIMSVFALGEMIGLIGEKHPSWRYITFMLAMGFAYILRPNFLSFVGFMPFLFLTLSFVKTQRWNIWKTVVIFILSISPFIMVSSVRYKMVNDFNIVSYGGVIITGLATSLLSEELIPKLAPEYREFAKTTLDQREAMVHAGELSPMVVDYGISGLGQSRSFRKTARSYFDILAFNFDEIWNKLTLKKKKPDESWVQFNKRMMSFSVDVVRNSPANYAMWILGGIRSAAGTAITQNISLLVGVGGLLAVYSFLLFTSQVPPVVVWSPLDIPAIVLITVFFTLGSGMMMLLVTFPANRYASTSATFFASIFFYMLFQLLVAAHGHRTRRV